MPDLTKTPVTVLGLGAMGAALARALLAAGHPVTVWNRTPRRAEPLVAAGATAAATAAEAIGACPLVVVCLLDNDCVREVLTGAEGELPGRVVVNLTNGTPGQARELAGWVGAAGADYVDGGIMAIPPMIATPSALVLYSGSAAAFEAHRGALGAFGEASFLGADPGVAAVHDLALLSGMYGMFGGILQAFALVGTTGTAAGDFAPVLRGWLEAMSGYIAAAAEQIDKGDYAIDVASNLAMQAAAIPNLLDGAAEQGISAELLAPLARLMARRAADGHGHEDVTGVIELLRV